MFTGIIEFQGKVVDILPKGSNITFFIESELTKQLKIDESVSHNGICLTIEKIEKKDIYQVTAVNETILKTNIKYWALGSYINLERAILLNARLDGHIVQGHVDDTARCVNLKDLNGSWEYTFEFNSKYAGLLIEKGSVCINGVSLTAYNVKKNEFTVSIIPYTYNHTNFNNLLLNNIVNIEYDILGKYVERILSLKQL